MHTILCDIIPPTHLYSSSNTSIMEKYKCISKYLLESPSSLLQGQSFPSVSNICQSTVISSYLLCTTCEVCRHGWDLAAVGHTHLWRKLPGVCSAYLNSLHAQVGCVANNTGNSGYLFFYFCLIYLGLVPFLILMWEFSQQSVYRSVTSLSISLK